MQMQAHTEFFANWTEYKLPDAFIEPYKTREVPWGFGDLSYVTYKRSYARPLDLANPHGPTEEWWQTCRRVIEGTISTYMTHAHDPYDTDVSVPWSNLAERDETAREMFERMFVMKFLPPGRGLFAMGTSAMKAKGGGCLNNCMFVTTGGKISEFANSMRRLMDFSMLGVGVGFDTRGAGFQYILPSVDGSMGPYIVEDTREGWCDLVHYILDAVTMGKSLAPGYKFGKVRPKGSPLNTFGGTASGPEPLITLVTWLLTTFGCKVQRVGLNLLVAPRSSGDTWLAFDELLLLDIGAQIGHCVVMGGIRRTALICLGDKDGALPTAKNDIGDQLWRYRSNNSVISRVGDDYAKNAAQTQKAGEPGYWWEDLSREFGRLIDPKDLADILAEGTNPCVEQTLFRNELCNLGETFPARHDSLEDYLRTLRCMYLYCKAVTLIPTHDPVVNEVIERNRRMGISMAGVVQAIEKTGGAVFFEEWCDKGYKLLRELDNETSDSLGVKRSIKLTSIKPGGTVPLLAGATPGMHWDHAPYYIRRERFSDDSPYLPWLAAKGYQLEACEDDPSSVAVSFLVRSTETEHKPDVSAWDQMALAADLQKWWADNQVSVTVHFRPEENLLELLKSFEGQLKGVSFIPYFDDTAGDLPYKQLPYETIDKDTYESMLANVTKAWVQLVGALGHEVTDAYCDSDRCSMVTPA